MYFSVGIQGFSPRPSARSTEARSTGRPGQPSNLWHALHNYLYGLFFGEARIAAAAEERREGGLGWHLIRQTMSEVRHRPRQHARAARHRRGASAGGLAARPPRTRAARQRVNRLG